MGKEGLWREFGLCFFCSGYGICFCFDREMICEKGYYCGDVLLVLVLISEGLVCGIRVLSELYSLTL